MTEVRTAIRMERKKTDDRGKKLTGRDVVCPYFRKEVSVAISCEGWFGPDTRVKLCFPDGERKERYMQRRCRCMGGYKRCLVARALEHKYAKEEDKSGQVR